MKTHTFASSRTGHILTTLALLFAILQTSAAFAQATFENAFPRLNFVKPIYLTYASDGSDTLFVVEQDGRILYFPNDRDVAQAKVAVDIRRQVRRAGNEEGLLGFAFHPDFQKNRQVILHYSASNPTRNVVARYRMADDGYVIDPDSVEVLMEVPQPWGNHNGGMIDFGPDGMLYISLGDGGAANDPHNVAQNLGSLLGKILRIDVDKTEGSQKYAIPKDNPFVEKPGARPEVWAWGLRNAWRFSFDRKTGDLWAGDVGQNAWEEIDLITKGGNYGWRVREGFHDFNVPREGKPADLIEPVVEHGRNEALSITGGYVYRGTAIPAMQGHYIYGDYVTGRVWSLQYDGKKVTTHKEFSRLPTISSFGEDEAGELYVVSHGGAIYRMIAAE
jgi:glucose/arabinose dehydrogenase